MTNTPYNKKRSCQTHKEGKENGAHNSGVLGLEKSELPIVANGPKPTKNQIRVKTQAKLTCLFRLGSRAETVCNKRCFLSFLFFSLDDSPRRKETKNVTKRLKIILKLFAIISKK